MRLRQYFRPSARRVIWLACSLGLVLAFLCIGMVRPSAQSQTPAADYSRFYQVDGVTAAIRNPSLTPVRIPVTDAASRAKASRWGTVIGDYKSFLVVAVPARSAAQVGGPDAQVLDTKVFLPGRSFDPLEDSVSAGSRGINFGGKDYYVIQLGGPTQDEWLDSLRAVGVEVLQYVAHHAFLVYGDATAIQKAGGHARVRWVGRYTAEDKLSPVLRSQLNTARGGAVDRTISPLQETAPGVAVFDLAVFARADLSQVAQTVNSISGVTVTSASALANNFFNLLRVSIPIAAVEQIAQIPDIVRIDAVGKRTPEDERSSQIISGNYTSTTAILAAPYDPLTLFGVDGTGVTVSVADDGISIPGTGGFFITAANTVDGPLRGASAGAAGGHGHLNASIIAGDAPFPALDPTGYNYGKGVAPKANIINLPNLRSGYTGTDAQTYNDSVTTSGPNGVTGFISNNSWGDGTNSNAYDSLAAQFDGIARDASTAATIDPILLVFSAGNSGNSGLTRPKMAKNVIATANSENLRTEISASAANNIDDIDSQSSRGLAADGRIKPDITAPGSVITGSRAGSGSTVTGQVNANVSYSIGTSHAAPQIAGAAALFTQFWKTNNGGANPSIALVKAAILNTGQEMNGTGSSLALPNKDEGWGRINMKLMLNPGVPMKFVNQTVALNSPGESSSLVGRVVDPTKPVRFMLVWTDPPAVADPTLINNLDLTVTVGANVYKGNVLTNGLSATGGTADTKNNVETIRLAAGVPAGTAVSIVVSATALNGDGILGNADLTDQHFALVAYNFAAAGNAVPSDFDGDGKSDTAVFRPSEGNWYLLKSSNGAFVASSFGLSADLIAPADYDGDAKTDLAVFRPSNGAWYILLSATNTMQSIFFGANGDVPQPADFDGDAKADIALFRPLTGAWYFLRSSTNNTSYSGTIFGVSGDIPATGDYDGDGKADFAVWKSNTVNWYVARSSDNSVAAVSFGASEDKPTPGDFDGDGKFDYAVWRPSSGVWYALKSSTGNASFTSVPFGVATDIPTPGDFDGDGKTDQAVFRPSVGTWYLLRSTTGFTGVAFGANGDKPTESAFIQ